MPEKPHFIEFQQKKEYTLEEKRIIKLHNMREYINSHISEGDYILTAEGRIKDPVLKSVCETLLIDFEISIIRIIEDKKELQNYYNIVTKAFKVS